MAEIITDVRFVTDVPIDDAYPAFCGYVVTTTRQVIRVLIDDQQYRRERYDVVLLVPPHIEKLIGLSVGISWGDRVDEKALRNADCPAADVSRVVVDVATNAGTFQIVAYNEHGGYFPHVVFVEWIVAGKMVREMRDV